MKKYSHTGLACAALVLAGCVAAPVQTPLPASSSSFSSAEQALTYHVMMGELALQRGASKTGVQQYARAAQSSTDPTLAQYATLLAYKDGDNSQALELTHRWLQLVPKDNDARHFEAVLNTRLGNVNIAVSEFEKLLAESPGENLQLISDLLGQETNAKEGLPVMQKLVAGWPESAQAHFALAQLAMHYQDAPLAIEETRRALILKSDFDQALILEARALLVVGNNSQALQLLKARVVAQPDNTRVHLAYATVLAQTEQNVLAQTEFTAINKQHPNDPDALYSLGLLALQANNLNAAKDYFTRLLKTGQRDNDARYFLGNTSELAKRYPEALHWYQQVNGGKNWLTAQISVARVLMSQHKPDVARSYIDDIVGMDPDDGVQFRIAEAQLFSDAGDSKTALQVFNQGLMEDPGNPDLLYARALLQEDIGDALAAENSLRQILAEQPDNADALNALGYMLALHSTNYQEARGYIEKALLLKPDDPAIIDSMGWVEYRLGNYPQALSYLRKAYAQLADPEIAAHLTEVLWVSGEKQEAHRIWSSALKQHPGDAALLAVGQRFSP
ncbi:MAG TPA: tetratricopeptide repeat protein [Gammaproteobacteria bacterium]|nr:tetratricopeptide repeat protein [Gammaproteobacteria bacterium]